MQKSKEKMLMMGQLGEKIVKHYAQQNGLLVEDSLSMYDSEKDLKINGRTAEVKTQMRFFTQNAFTVKENQVRKCLNADLLYFVESPSRDDTSIKVWECSKEDRQFRTYRTRDGRTMKLLDVDDMELIYVLDDPKIVREMKSFSNSEW